MSSAEVMYQASRGLWLVLQLSLPAIIVASVVGLLVSLFQALTQIQEQTLPFAFKLVSIVVVLLVTARWIGFELIVYTQELMGRISTL